jgi:hypothetical protein
MTEATKKTRRPSLNRKPKEERKLIDNRSGSGATKSSIARQIMIQYNGTKTYKEFVDEIQAQTGLSRMICARYLKSNAARLPDFKTVDGNMFTTKHDKVALARQIMEANSGKVTHDQLVKLLMTATGMTKAICIRYIRANAKKVPDFTLVE